MALTLNGTTGIAGIAGSAGTPALQGNNDTNTGYFFATDTLGLSTAGSERLHINSSGKVRVGSGSATYNFEVQNTGFVETLIGSTNASGAGINLDGDSNGDGGGADYAQIFHQTDGTLNFRARNGSGGTDTIFLSGTTERLRITAAGDVGIGYNSPTVKLHVREGASGFSGTYDNRYHMICENSGEAYFGFYVPDNSYAGIRFHDTTGQEGLIDYYFVTDDMHFHSSGTHIFKTAGSERLRITSAGKLGIGTTTPSGLLHVHQADSGTVDALIVTNTSTTNNGLSIGVNSTEEAFFWNGSNTSMNFATNNVERLRIDSSGNLTAVNTASGGQSVTLKVGASNASGTNDGVIRIVNGGTGNGVLQWDYEGNAARAQIYLYRSTQDLIFTTAGSERMRVTGGDTIAMGASSYGGGGANPRLYLKSNSGRQFKIHNPDSGTTALQLTNNGSGEGEDTGLFIALLSSGAGYIKNNVNNADFMDWYCQVAGSGKHILKVYNTGKHGIQSNDDCLMCSTSQDGSGSNYFLRGSKNSTTPGGGNDVAWIYEDGDMYNANGTFSQGSDVALKENIVDANSQWADIKGLKFRNFNFKASTGLDTHKQLGLVAQEVEPISPGLIKDRDKIVKTTNSDGTVTETTDGTTKSIKLSILYMKGMKALQEAMSRIETLEAKVTSLESA